MSTRRLRTLFLLLSLSPLSLSFAFLPLPLSLPAPAWPAAATSLSAFSHIARRAVQNASSFLAASSCCSHGPLCGGCRSRERAVRLPRQRLGGRGAMPLLVAPLCGEREPLPFCQRLTRGLSHGRQRHPCCGTRPTRTRAVFLRRTLNSCTCATRARSQQPRQPQPAAPTAGTLSPHTCVFSLENASVRLLTDVNAGAIELSGHSPHCRMYESSQTAPSSQKNRRAWAPGYRTSP